MKLVSLSFLLLLFMSAQSSSQVSNDLKYLQSQWATAKQQISKNQPTNLDRLSKTATQFVLNHPKQTDYLIWEAKIYTLMVENSSKLKAINHAKHARNSLKEAMLLSSDEQLGYIYSNLGYLYLVSPDLSLSFKSDLKEESYFLKGLKLNPFGLESNYYYALYLLTNNKPELAKKYLQIALNSSESELPEKITMLIKLEIERSLSLVN